MLYGKDCWQSTKRMPAFSVPHESVLLFLCSSDSDSGSLAQGLRCQ